MMEYGTDTSSASDPEQFLLRKNAKAIEALERFHTKLQDIEQCLDSVVLDEIAPQPVSAAVWVLLDGLAMTRYWDWRGKSRFEPVVQLCTLDQWLWEKKLIPTERGRFPFATLFAGGAGTFELHNFISTVPIRCLIRYAVHYVIDDDDLRLSDPEGAAAADFAFSLTGRTLKKTTGGSVDREDAFHLLRAKAEEFESLLATAEGEEELKQFLKENPFLLGSHTQMHCELPLGNEYKVDFVLECVEASGTLHRFIEIERATHRLFNKKADQTRELSHAIGQVTDWSRWCTENRNYLKNHELPRVDKIAFQIIIGRSFELTDKTRDRLRTTSDGLMNCEILTYDDLLARFRQSISTMAQIDHLGRPKRA